MTTTNLIKEKKITKKEQKAIDLQQAKDTLKKWIDPKKGIIIVIKSVSSSGMSRRMTVHSHDGSGDLSYLVSEVLGWSSNNKGIQVSGCGMDMTFHLAYCLTRALYTKKEQAKLTGNGSGCLPWKVL